MGCGTNASILVVASALVGKVRAPGAQPAVIHGFDSGLDPRRLARNLKTQALMPPLLKVLALVLMVLVPGALAVAAVWAIVRAARAGLKERRLRDAGCRGGLPAGTGSA